MPSALSTLQPTAYGIIKFTNCRRVLEGKLVKADLWFSSKTGKTINGQAAFFNALQIPDKTIDLGGRIVSAGLIDCQLNGAFGFNFSTLPDSPSAYQDEVANLNKKLVQTGVTSYLPTITSQKPDLYQTVLPLLGPSGTSRLSQNGAESLGAHVEGPFLSPTKNGIHDVSVLREANTLGDILECYGESNIIRRSGEQQLPVKMITAAPEVAQMARLIPDLRSNGIIFSMGHSESTFEEALAAHDAGAVMITHLFNAMRPLHHRNPGMFGLLGSVKTRPYFGIIADGIHLHPTTVKLAYNAHSEGLILVTDAMHMTGLPDGKYEWSNGGNNEIIVKIGSKLLLDGSDRIAGSSITLIECVNNFLAWTDCSIIEALKAVTATPAVMLGLAGVKGTLDEGADADIVVFSETTVDSTTQLTVDEVWKFGKQVFCRV